MSTEPRLIDTIKEWGIVILSALGIMFLITLMSKNEDDSDIVELENDIKDVEESIKRIEESTPDLQEIVDRWNDRYK